MVVERLPAENVPPCIYTGHLWKIVNLGTYPGYSVFVHSITKHVKKTFLDRKMTLGSPEIFDVKMGSQPKKGWEPLD